VASPVLTERDGRVLVVLLHRPSVRNALDLALIEALSSGLRAAAADDRIAVVVLASSDPRAFSTGMDTRAVAEHGGQVLRRLLDLQWQLESFAKPLVASLPGGVVGAGAELALSADVRVGDATTVFRFPSTAYGLVQGSWHLADAVGASRARELVLTGREVLAGECASLGLLHFLDDDAYGHARALARSMAERHDGAMTAAKRLILTADGRSRRARFEEEYEVNTRLVEETRLPTDFGEGKA
jgi:enoyl-CoA hydratase/carnithine racemase